MLYLVATPIGNLKDISLRALEVLKDVDIIASEDTRKTGLLLKHFEIQKPQISFHAFNEQKTVLRLIELLEHRAFPTQVTCWCVQRSTMGWK
jgi:16S rRNA (cytidine1402-2'-O)-methyltransferase